MEKLCQKSWNIYHLEMIFPVKHTKTIIYYIYIGDWYPKNWTVWYKTVAPAARNAATRFSQLDQEPRHFFLPTEEMGWFRLMLWVSKVWDTKKHGATIVFLRLCQIDELDKSHGIWFLHVSTLWLKCFLWNCLFLSAGWTFAQPQMACILLINMSLKMLRNPLNPLVSHCWIMADASLKPMYVPHEIAI